MKYNELCNICNINLNAEQEMAVKKTKGPTLMISVPGSGKTTVIITRIAHMILCENIPPEDILTVTFSVEAARTMRERFASKFGDEVGDILPEFSTIHSVALKIIKLYCKTYNKTPFKIIEKSESVIGNLIKLQSKGGYKDGALKEIINMFSKIKNLMIDREEWSEWKVNGIRFEQVYEAYENHKLEHGLMDFDDMLVFALDILQKYPDILDYIQKKYTYFNVDEAQDNSLVQNRIIRLISSKYNNLFMVGDEDQCIYGFRGAYPQAFFEFSEKYGEDNIIKLQTNYRSCDLILKLSEKFISQNKNRYSKRLIGVQNKPGSVKLKEFRDMYKRNLYILEDSRKYDSVAILSRNNESLISTADLFMSYEVPFNMKSGRNDFLNSIPVRDIVTIFSLAVGNSPPKIPRRLENFTGNPRKLRYISEIKPFDAIHFIIDDMYYAKFLMSLCTNGYSKESLCSKLNVLTALSVSCNSCEEFLEKLEQINKLCQKGSLDKKTFILTCHGSKGLEFDKVYILDVVDRLFPSGGALINSAESEYNAEYEEEVRLFYVALTRAKSEIEILNVKNLYWGSSCPSIFAKEIMKDLKFQQGLN